MKGKHTVHGSPLLMLELSLLQHKRWIRERLDIEQNVRASHSQTISSDRLALLDVSNPIRIPAKLSGYQNYNTFDGDLGAAPTESTDKVFASLVGRSAIAPFPREWPLTQPLVGRRPEVIT